ncbi:MAG: DNA-binding protein [Geobacteraceae bacterium GWC2_58_44]|nr:MAG: DNA-binding protein [Geobacteraceae bacterium GWC2_58_44]HBG05464.1 DNA-binding protein [Geobacter sp.]
MTLENLLKIGQLKSHATSKEEVQRLLASARRNLADAEVEAISTETRFDSAYKAIMQASLVALMANGYRPDTSRPGHHVTTIQSLPTTIGLPSARMVVLDVLRRKRNLADYTGDWIDETLMESSIAEAKALLRDVEAWLQEHKPGLLEE